MIDGWMMWVIIAIVLFIVELVTPGTFYFFCVAIGAVFAAVASVLANQVVTWVVFFVVSIILIVLSRPIVKKFNREKTREANTDELIGRTARVTEVVTRDKPGMVKINGEVWLAKSNERVEAEEEVNVVRTDGNYLVVEKNINKE